MIKTTDEILSMFRMSKYPLNDDGTRRKKYHKLIKQKWVSLEYLSKMNNQQIVDLISDYLQNYKEYE